MSAPTIDMTRPGSPRPVPQAEQAGAGTPNLNDLVTRAQHGDPEAFAEIYRRYTMPIYRFVAAKVTNRLDVEDITADVLCKALHGIREFTGVSLTGWLFTIASNAVVDHYRRTGARREQTYGMWPGVDTADPDSDPADVYDVYLTNTALHAAIRALPRVQGEVMVLRYLVGLTPADTARTLNLTVPAVRGHQHRALTSLRASGFLSDLPGARGGSAAGTDTRSGRWAA